MVRWRTAAPYAMDVSSRTGETASAERYSRLGSAEVEEAGEMVRCEARRMWITACVLVVSVGLKGGGGNSGGAYNGEC